MPPSSDPAISEVAVRRARLDAGLIGNTVGRTRAARASAPRQVVEHLFAAQGQDFGQALWAIGVRARGTTRPDVLAAFDRGELVRSWPMRGTLHITTPDDLRTLLSLTAARTLRTIATRFRQTGIEPAHLDRVRDTLISALSGGIALERDHVLERIRARGIDTGEYRGYNLLLHFAQEGLVAWGPTRRVGQALVLLDDWVPPARAPLDRDEALARTFVGYLRGRGPATLADFAGWIKLPLAEARRAREVAGDTVEQVDATRWALPEPHAGRAAPSAHLLPAYDEYILGYVDRTALFRHHPEPIVSVNGIVAPVAIVRGRIVGRWSRPTPDGSIVLTPFDPLSASDIRALEKASDRLGQFLRRDITLAIDLVDSASADVGTRP